MAVNEWYIDPVAGDDTTGDGSSGNPWQTLLYAIDTGTTRDATNGDAYNLADTGPDVLGTAINATTAYGSGTSAVPFIIRGWDRGNGGIGEISGGGSVAIFSALVGADLSNLKLHNCGSAAIITGSDFNLYNVEVTNTSGNGIVFSGGNLGSVVRCNVHNIGGVGITTRLAVIKENYLKNGASQKFTTAISVTGGGAVVNRNILSLDGSSSGIIVVVASTSEVKSNSVRSSSGTGVGIGFSGSGRSVIDFRHNIVAGFSGSGGINFNLTTNNYVFLYGGNASYNGTTGYVESSVIHLNLGDNESLGANPFAESGSDTFANRGVYFSPVDTGNVHGGAGV